ncbi:MAG TPA: FAD-linked oxidase C-terminal domain-containing protein [Longimicrobiales bacterium]|nr:FAD-linked oxidase C-terminal domain-containing protein [Longimicrobiales bacterium]
MTPAVLPAALARDFLARLGSGGVVTEPGRLLAYESDALPRFRQLPAAVLLPRDTEEAAWVVGKLVEAGVPITPRGAGTGLSGGGVAAPGGALVGTSRMKRILSLDPVRRLARVQAGVINTDLSAAAAPFGLHYAPDPSSQTACTLGGNVGENAGGPHCLKYGVTTRYVTGLTVVTGRGEVVELGGAQRGERLDLVGLFVGSEGRMGLATELELRLIPRARAVRTFLAVFHDTEAAGAAVSAIIAQGLLPAAMEIMDRGTIQAVEASVFAAGYPTDAGAVLVVEFDGTEAGLDAESEQAQALCLTAGATELRRARDERERQALWQGRKKAYGAFGRLTADLMVQDATVPRSSLPGVLRRIEEIGRKHDLVVANVFHAGDGNLHPKILFDRRDPELVERVELASKEIMRVCVEAGGTITGEHGVGLDKKAYMSLVHGPEELRLMARVQAAFDPAGVWNPGKVLPDDAGDGSDVALPTRSTGRVDVGTLPRAVQHDPPDLTVTVSASVPVRELEAVVARNGQWLPLDVPGMDGWTVGELVTCGLWGPSAPAFGRIRDLLLGARLVTGDGRCVRLGGRVMKNVAGFDLVRGVAGSRGRWGVVTEATFRLNPIPDRHRVLMWEGGAEEMRGLARRLATHPIFPAAVVRVGGGDGSRVLLRLLGSNATVEAESAELERDLPGAEPWDGVTGAPGFVRLDPLGEAVAGEAAGPVLELRPGALEWEEVESLLSGAPGGPAVFHHLPLWDVWRIPRGDGDAAGWVRETLAGVVREAGGDVVWQREVSPDARVEGDRAGQGGALRALEEAVCRAFDPAGILPAGPRQQGEDGWSG